MHSKIKIKLFCFVSPTCKKKAVLCGSFWNLEAVYTTFENTVLAYYIMHKPVNFKRGSKKEAQE